MDSFGELIFLIFILYVCFWLLTRKKKYTNNEKGDIGEKAVAYRLLALGADYRVKNSIDEILTVGKYQIDHVVINDMYKVIYVIETKNWSGNIKGSKDDNKWTANINGKMIYYGNPVKQNKLHCDAIKNKYPSYRVESIIVFANDEVKWKCRCKNIIRVYDLLEYIENDIRRKMIS